jgi:hypothetical protein
MTQHYVCGVFDVGVVCHIFIIGVISVVGVIGVTSIIYGGWFSLSSGWSKKLDQHL